jgi:hypothetical protein
MAPACLAILLLAGCVSGQPEAAKENANPDDVAPSNAPDAKATDATGAIDVRIQDDERNPIPKALVEVAATGLVRLTDDAGRASFNGLEPKKYTLLVSKTGYRNPDEKGRILDVKAGEVNQVEITLLALAIVTEETSYYEVEPMQGFIACSVGFYFLGEWNQCGRGVNVSGTTYFRDPNDNSTHVWTIDNPQYTAWHMEGLWTPTNSALGTNLRTVVYGYLSCNNAVSCVYMESFGSRAGPSPLRWLTEEGTGTNITNRIGKEAKFPHHMEIEVRPSIHSLVPGTAPATHSIMYQQRYDLYMSVFYGMPHPAGYTALPPE